MSKKLTEAQRQLVEDMESHDAVINRHDWYDERKGRMRVSFRLRCVDWRWSGDAVHPGTVRALLDAGLITFQPNPSMPFYYLTKNAR